MTKRNGNAQGPWFTKFAAGAVGVVFVLFWSALTGVGDVVIAYDIARQCATYGYASTEGTITRSEITEHSDSDGGVKHRLLVEYDYLVGDHKFHGDQLRFQSDNGRDDARELKARFQVDSRHPVHYSAGDPSRAVLLCGLEGRDLFLPMFMMPFNIVMIVGWLAIYYTWFPRPAYAETGGVRVRDDGLEIRAFVPDNSSMFVFGVALFGTSVAMVFIVGFMTGFDPSLEVMIGVWGLIFAVAIWFAAPRFYRERTGLSDLVIDRFGKRLTLPVTHGRKQPREVPFAAIESITMKDVCKVDSDGDATHTYHVLLREQSSNDNDCVWVASEEAKAKQFLTWFRNEIGIFPDSPSKTFKH